MKEIKRFIHGGDYNPEQWLDMPEIIDKDIEMMKKCNFNTVTIGVFSWSHLEPEEGKYDFSFMDEIFDKTEKAGIDVILATPSGARPVWMAKKYPEVLRTREDRTKQLYGFRHNHCYTAPVYREKTRKINELLAKRYGERKNLLMWHVSNEYDGECHCEMCINAFRKWLKNKYKTIDTLNKAYWSSFWSHRFSSFDEVEPNSSIGDGTLYGLELDWRRFVTYQTIDFMKNEIAPLREITPDIPITTNYIGSSNRLDYRKMSKELDVVSWDNYPQWHEGDDVSLGADVGFDHDLFRGFLKKPFLMMESSPSTIKRVDKYKRPGFGNLVALQAIAHGSESAQYFQWRRGRGAAEQFHGSVVDHNDRDDTLIFKEVTKTGTTLANINEMLSTNVKSKIALLYEYDIFWILNKIDGYNRFDKKYKPTVLNHYRQFWNMGKNADIIGRDDDLSGYDLVILPMCFMVEETFIKKVKEYVENGGCVVATYMTAVSDENDLCYYGGAPANELKEVFGLEVEQTDGLYADDRNYVEYNGKTYEAKDYCEVVNLKGGKSLAEYKEDYYKGCPAVVENSYGKGKAYYIAFRDNGDFLKDFYEEISKDIKPEFDGNLKYGVTAHSRENFVILENFNNYDEELVCKKDYINIQTGEKFNGKIKAYETLFLK